MLHGIPYVTQLDIKLHGLLLHDLILHDLLYYTIKLQDLLYVILQIHTKFVCNVTIRKAGVMNKGTTSLRPPA